MILAIQVLRYHLLEMDKVRTRLLLSREFSTDTFNGYFDRFMNFVRILPNDTLTVWKEKCQLTLLLMIEKVQNLKMMLKIFLDFKPRTQPNLKCFFQCNRQAKTNPDLLPKIIHTNKNEMKHQTEFNQSQAIIQHEQPRPIRGQQCWVRIRWTFMVYLLPISYLFIFKKMRN